MCWHLIPFTHDVPSNTRCTADGYIEQSALVAKVVPYLGQLQEIGVFEYVLLSFLWVYCGHTVLLYQHTWVAFFFFGFAWIRIKSTMKSQGKRMTPSMFGSLFSCFCCSTAFVWQFVWQPPWIVFEATRHRPKISWRKLFSCWMIVMWISKIETETATGHVYVPWDFVLRRVFWKSFRGNVLWMFRLALCGYCLNVKPLCDS